METLHCLFCLLVVLSVPTAVLPDSHSLTSVITYIRGETPFPELTAVVMLDDLPVGYYDSEKSVFVSRGLNKDEEEDVFDPNIRTIFNYIQTDFEWRYENIKNKLNHTEKIHVQQILTWCELLDNDQPGALITKIANRGFVVNEYHYYDGKYTYTNALNITEESLKSYTDSEKWLAQSLYYPVCTKALRDYLKKRNKQVKKKVKPRVRFIKRRRSVSGWDGVTCLATGFYPRHINLTIFRDEQPVPDHLITGGELLPNGDGTYQMRKNLELSEEEVHKHTFNCTVTHLSLDNKLDIQLELDPGEPIMVTLWPVLVVVILLCVIGAVIGLWMFRRCRKQKPGSGESFLTTVSQRGSSSASSEEESETSSLNASGGHS